MPALAHTGPSATSDRGVDSNDVRKPTRLPRSSRAATPSQNVSRSRTSSACRAGSSYAAGKSGNRLRSPACLAASNLPATALSLSVKPTISLTATSFARTIEDVRDLDLSLLVTPRPERSGRQPYQQSGLRQLTAEVWTARNDPASPRPVRLDPSCRTDWAQPLVAPASPRASVTKTMWDSLQRSKAVSTWSPDSWIVKSSLSSKVTSALVD